MIEARSPMNPLFLRVGVFDQHLASASDEQTYNSPAEPYRYESICRAQFSYMKAKSLNGDLQRFFFRTGVIPKNVY